VLRENNLVHPPPPLSPNVTSSVIQTLVLYSLAEHQLGHATSIRVTANGHAFAVEDDGRGHAVNRTVEGSPYLDFIYTHLDYPFRPGSTKPVQLHGLGMSLLNRLCAELKVSVRKSTATMNMTFESGRLVHHELVESANEITGNTISGRVDSRHESGAIDESALCQWLLGILAGSPSLRLRFNGQALSPPPRIRKGLIAGLA